MLLVEKLFKNYIVDAGREIEIIRGVSFQIKAGEFVSIVGESGSGKTTLLYLLGGLEKATSGTILLDGENIVGMRETQLSDLRKNKIGYVFQSYNLIQSLTAKDNIAFPLRLSRTKNHEIEKRISYLSEILNITSVLDKQPHQLSGGEQQRVAIARALSYQPQVIFADEPTGNLDSKTGDKVFCYLQDINRELNTTIIMVTHSLELAGQTARQIRIQDGVIYDE